MPDTFEGALQSQTVELTGLRSESVDGEGLVMARDPATGRRAFRFICPRRTEPVGQPVIDSVTIRGFDLAGCAGQQVCEQSTSLRTLDLFEPYKSTAGTDLIYNPKTHDGGAIEALAAQCGCDHDDIESSRLIVHLTLQWEDPTFTLMQGYTFVVCQSCRSEDNEDDRLG
jgi:hypothetical protein